MFVIQDKRYHIVEELYRNEREYVEALGVLKEVSCLGLIVHIYIYIYIPLHFAAVRTAAVYTLAS